MPVNAALAHHHDRRSAYQAVDAFCNLLIAACCASCCANRKKTRARRRNRIPYHGNDPPGSSEIHFQNSGFAGCFLRLSGQPARDENDRRQRTEGGLGSLAIRVIEIDRKP
jgi:hypothetical protein